jgi:hypothetical protein
MDIKYAVIRYSELTDDHITLIRATGVNSYRWSIVTTPENVEPKRCIVEWDNDIAKNIPEAVAAIQRIIDEEIPIWDEYQMREYLQDPYCPFNLDPPGSSSSSSSIDSSSSSSMQTFDHLESSTSSSYSSSSSSSSW